MMMIMWTIIMIDSTDGGILYTYKSETSFIRLLKWKGEQGWNAHKYEK